MGSFARVVSGWEENGCFTYSYGRVETLNGFCLVDPHLRIFRV
jgi:hypothetical protein